MKKTWFLIAGFLLGASLASWADPVKMDAAPKVEESTPEADKAAAQAASTEADKWAAANAKKEVPKPAVEAAQAAPTVSTPATAPVPTPTSAPTPTPVETPKSATPPAAHRTGLNEMRGKFQSHSTDPRSLRVIVDGGYNVEFSYDGKTAIADGSAPVAMDDLNYGDELIVRYSGKELYALEIERVTKAPRPQ